MSINEKGPKEINNITRKNICPFNINDNREIYSAK
jgi:hypothetical protein